ncbi:hypothetical protein OIU78_024961 [Salix suchowensis]|nr:hypothetical protein OIU78_024961 [Salix suchowensis]
MTALGVSVWVALKVLLSFFPIAEQFARSCLRYGWCDVSGKLAVCTVTNFNLLVGSEFGLPGHELQNTTLTNTLVQFSMDAIIIILAIVLGIMHVFVRELDELNIMHEVVEVCMPTMILPWSKAGGIGEEFPMLEAKILLSYCFLGCYYFGL